MLGDEVDLQFILTNFAPNIRKRFDCDTAIILGTTLLYSIFCIDDSTNNVPFTISSRVRNAFSQIEFDTARVVKRVPAVCTRNEGEIYIDDSISDEQLQAQDNQGTNFTNINRSPGNLTDRPLRDQLRAMQSQLQSVKYTIQVVEKKIEANHLNELRCLSSVSANMKRFAAALARPILATTAIVTSTANLTSCPRTLHDLWDEYTVGIGGAKPTKDYTAQERGKCKYKYYR